jgi:hypothetical protein
MYTKIHLSAIDTDDMIDYLESMGYRVISDIDYRSTSYAYDMLDSLPKGTVINYAQDNFGPLVGFDNLEKMFECASINGLSSEEFEKLFADFMYNSIGRIHTY